MRNRSLPTSNDVWGCWNLKRAADGEIMIDFFVTNGSPRDPWVALVPLSVISSSGHAHGLLKLADRHLRKDQVDGN